MLNPPLVFLQPWWNYSETGKTLNGRKLRSHRLARQIPAKELAAWAFITEEDLYEYETEKRSPPEKTAQLLVIGVTGKKEIGYNREPKKS